MVLMLVYKCAEGLCLNLCKNQVSTVEVADVSTGVGVNVGRT